MILKAQPDIGKRLYLQLVTQATLEEREQEVARLSEPATRDTLSKQQLERLKAQEAEIAELKARLEQGGAVQSSQDAATSVPSKAEQSSHDRHHLFDMPAAPPPATCRQALPLVIHGKLACQFAHS